MKVYSKKHDKNTIIPGIIVTIILLLVSSGIFIASVMSEKSFIDVLSSFGILLLFAVIFLGFSIYFIYILIKKPKDYKAKLINKKIEIYKGKQITYMKFSTEKEREQEEDFISSEYKCYTIGKNNLIVGNDYSLGIKEFNWEPKYVEELKNRYKNKITDKVPNMTMSPVFLTIGLIFGGLLFLCILGIIIYPQYTSIYIIAGIFFGISLFVTFKGSKTWKMDNNLINEKTNANLKLEKIKPLEKKQKKVGNIVIKHLLILLISFPIVWFLIIKIDIGKESFIMAHSTVLLGELIIIIMILYNIGYDERLIKKHKISITENLNISDICNFNIFRPTRNVTFPQYFIVDQNKNLILKIKKSNFWGNKYVICNQGNIKIGEIKSRLFSLTNEFIINIINEKPFIIRSKMQFHSNYQVIGRDYYIKGDNHFIKNIIYDNKNNDIAYISAISKNNNNWYELGNMEITLNNNVNNNLDIIIMALCITMGNFQIFDRKTDR